MSGLVDQWGRPLRGAGRARGDSGGGSGLNWAFDAARQAGYRGWFWFPELDPGQQVTAFTRTQIARKMNWAYNNIGAIRAVVDGLALDEVDTGLWPKPATASPAFNAAVKLAFDQQCGFHKAFSASGDDNFYSGQYLVRRELRLRGDCFAQKLRPGENAATPQIAFLGGWQCDNAETRLDQSQWRDGRMDGRFGRALKYRFLQGRDRVSFRDLDAADVIHFHDPFLVGQKRGISELAPVVGKLFSYDDIFRHETNSVILRSRIAYAIERKAEDDGGFTVLPGTEESEVIEQADGSKLFVQKIVSRDGQEVDVAELPGGRTLRVVESMKSSESSGWLKELLTAVAQCTKYPPEYLFGLGGLSQGTLVRMAQGKVQRVFNTVRDFQLIQQYIDEWWPFWLWQNIARGTFDGVRGGIPDVWWPYRVVRPKNITVDEGREGRLYDDRVATGKMPAGLYVGMLYGEDHEDVEDEIIRDAYRRRRRVREIAEEMGESPIAPEAIFRPPAGGPATPESDPAPEDDEDEDPDLDPEERAERAFARAQQAAADQRRGAGRNGSTPSPSHRSAPRR